MALTCIKSIGHFLSIFSGSRTCDFKGGHAKLVNLLREYGLPTETDYPAADLLAKMLSDKKRAGDTISLVVPTGWGKSQLYPVPVSQLPVWLDRGLGK